MSSSPDLLVNQLSLRRSRAGGAETYALNLIPRIGRAWPGRFQVLLREDQQLWIEELGWPKEWLSGVRPIGSGSISVPLTSASATMRVRRAGGVVLSPYNVHTPGADRDHEVVGVHDLLIARYVSGEWGPLKPRERLEFPVKARALARSVRRARAVVVHAEATKADLFRWVPDVDPSRVHVVPLGVSSPLVAPAEPAGESRVGQGQPFVLVVGSSTAPHKNLDLLNQAARTSAFRNTGAEVVMVGRTVPEVPADLVGTVRTMADVSDEVLRDLYRRCVCLVFPSLAEGFGLPLLEGLSLGVPCVVSDLDLFREIGADAPVYFDPRSPEALASAVIRVMSDAGLARSMAAAGPRRAAAYTWDAAAEGYSAAIHEAAN